jgi:hypothetical protein
MIQHLKHEPLLRVLLESLLSFGLNSSGLPPFLGDVSLAEPDGMPWAFEVVEPKDDPSPVLTGLAE